MLPLRLDRIDHFILGVGDVVPAHEAITRLGLAATPPAPVADTTSVNSSFTVGGGDKVVAVEFLSGPDTADGPMLGFAAPDLEPARAAFDAHGGFTETEVRMSDDAVIRTLRPSDTSAAGCAFLLLEYPPSIVARRAAMAAAAHDLPLRRLDHLAMIPPDFDEGTRYWADVLGVPLHHEIPADGVVIRQLRVGDVMVELLRATSPESRIAGAPPGLRSMIACEVDDVAACVDHARSRGFTAPDPAPGLLPGTVISTVDPNEVAGLAVQLLQYV